jgi:hypothetical protein
VEVFISAFTREDKFSNRSEIGNIKEEEADRKIVGFYILSYCEFMNINMTQPRDLRIITIPTDGP